MKALTGQDKAIYQTAEDLFNQIYDSSLIDNEAISVVIIIIENILNVRTINTVPVL